MTINTIKKMRDYLICNSTFPERTVNEVIKLLGYPLNGSGKIFKRLSSEFVKCAENGADIGISGFVYYSETIPFFKANSSEIANHLERTAEELGTDIFSMVQGFGVFRNTGKPSPSVIGRALWDVSHFYHSFTDLYNVFAWYALEEISRTWYRYLEDNPAIAEKLSA